MTAPHDSGAAAAAAAAAVHAAATSGLHPIMSSTAALPNASVSMPTIGTMGTTIGTMGTMGSMPTMGTMPGMDMAASMQQTKAGMMLPMGYGVPHPPSMSPSLYAAQMALPGGVHPMMAMNPSLAAAESVPSCSGGDAMPSAPLPASCSSGVGVGMVGGGSDGAGAMQQYFMHPAALAYAMQQQYAQATTGMPLPATTAQAAYDYAAAAVMPPYPYGVPSMPPGMFYPGFYPFLGASGAPPPMPGSGGPHVNHTT